jgi:hypothetical protein
LDNDHGFGSLQFVPDLDALAAKLDKKKIKLGELVQIYDMATNCLPTMVEKLSTVEGQHKDILQVAPSTAKVRFLRTNTEGRVPLQAKFIGQANAAIADFSQFVALIETVVDLDARPK